MRNKSSDKIEDPKENTVLRKRSQTFNTSNNATFQFVDNRPEAIAQRKLQEMTNNSSLGQKTSQLQALFNNPRQTTATPTLQRNEVEATKRKEENFKSIGALSLASLLEYTRSQADWHIGLNETEFHFVFTILNFIQETQSLGIYGKFKVKEFYDYEGSFYKSLPELIQVLSVAQKETDSSTTGFSQPIQEAAMFTSLPVFFKGINELQNFYKFVPKSIQKTMLGDLFSIMCLDGSIHSLYKYIATKPTPIFESNHDTYSFSKNPNDYIKYATSSNLKKLNFIHNFHRFDLGVLNLLERNSKDTSGKKPLTLIIYTSHDPSGSFVQKDSLPPVVANPNNLTILIEGMGSLGGFQKASSFVADRYGGKDKRIAQILICGHGSSQEVDLVGDPDGKERLSVKGDTKPTLAFFQHLISLMYKYKPPTGLGYYFSKSPKTSEMDRLSRIVFSACEVNSVVLPESQGDIDNAGGLDNFFKKNKSLVQTIIDLTGEGTDAYPKIKGANASVRSKGQKLIDDGSGKLDLVSSKDPSLTASKIEYMEKGTMVDGVVGATAYCLANDYKNAVAAITRRLKTKPKGLEDVFIFSLFRFLQQEKYEIAALLTSNSKLTSVYNQFRTFEGSRQPAFIASNIKHCFLNPNIATHAQYIIPLFGDIKYNGSPIVELAVAQIHCAIKNDPSWILRIGSKLSCQEIAPYLSWDILKPVLKGILSGWHPAAIKLAICGLVKGDTDCQKYLQGAVIKTPKEQFNPKLVQLLEEGIKGFSAVNSLPALLYKVTGKEESSQSKLLILEDEKFQANVTPDGSKENTVFIWTKYESGSFNQEAITFHRLPEPEMVSKKEKGQYATKKYTAKKTEEVSIIGETKKFWAIKHPTEKYTTFVEKKFITTGKFIPKKLNNKELRTD